MHPRIVLCTVTVMLGTSASGCRDRSTRAADVEVTTTTPASRTSSPPSPHLAAGSRGATRIDGLDDAPAAARDRAVAVVAAIEHGRSDEFLASVSSSGFAVGTLALNAEQVQRELEGRTVAELTNLPCDRAVGCDWRVSGVEPNRIALEAHVRGTPVGEVRVVREDDGSWAVIGAAAAATGP